MSHCGNSFQIHTNAQFSLEHSVDSYGHAVNTWPPLWNFQTFIWVTRRDTQVKFNPLTAGAAYIRVFIFY